MWQWMWSAIDRVGDQKGLDLWSSPRKMEPRKPFKRWMARWELPLGSVSGSPPDPLPCLQLLDGRNIRVETVKNSGLREGWRELSRGWLCLGGEDVWIIYDAHFSDHLLNDPRCTKSLGRRSSIEIEMRIMQSWDWCRAREMLSRCVPFFRFCDFHKDQPSFHYLPTWDRGQRDDDQH